MLSLWKFIKHEINFVVVVVAENESRAKARIVATVLAERNEETAKRMQEILETCTPTQLPLDKPGLVFWAGFR